MTKELNTGEPVAQACQIVEADFETNILKIEMLDENYKVSAGIKYLCDTHPIKELSRMDIYELAIESGFMLSTQYGEAEHKLMPVSDGDTLVKLANAILRKAQEK